MRALVFNPTIPRFLVTKALGTVSRAAVMARTSALQFREIPEPPLPGDEWVRIGVRLGGICGSDLHTIRLETSPAMSALTSFPFVLGHENVGAVLEAGRAVPTLRPGQRVTVEPVLPCAARGVPACPLCAAGRYNLCVRTTEGHLSPGLMIGACRDTDPITATMRTLSILTDMVRASGTTEPLRFTSALADGENLYAFRYSNNDTPNTLYYREAADNVVVVSEPLDTDRANWRLVPQRHLIVARRHGPVELLPFPEEVRIAAE